MTPSARIVTAVFIFYFKNLVALRAGESALDPVLALHARRRIDALRGEALDVDERHHLLRRVVLRAADRRVLHRLVAVAERHADGARGRFPRRALQRGGELLG